MLEGQGSLVRFLVHPVSNEAVNITRTAFGPNWILANSVLLMEKTRKCKAFLVLRKRRKVIQVSLRKICTLGH